MKCSGVEGAAACTEQLLGGVREMAGNYFKFCENSGRDGGARPQRVPLGPSQLRVGGEGCGMPRGGDSVGKQQLRLKAEAARIPRCSSTARRNTKDRRTRTLPSFNTRFIYFRQLEKCGL